MGFLPSRIDCILDGSVNAGICASAERLSVPFHYETEQATGTEEFVVESIESFVLPGA